MKEPVDDVDFVVAEGRNQTAASLLFRVASDGGRLGRLLRASSPAEVSDEDVHRVQELLGAVHRDARSAKAANGVLFFVALAVFLVATLWPAMEFVWDPMGYELVNGLGQSALFMVGGVLLAVYRGRKIRQTALENAMSHTMVRTEPVAAKIERLLAPLAPTRDETAAEESHEGSPEGLSTAAELRRRLERTTGSVPTPGQTLAVAVQLKEAGIKAYSYRWLDVGMSILTVCSILVGLTLPLTGPLLGWKWDSSVLGMAQSLLVLGLGGMFWGIHKQYAHRRRRVLDVMRRVLYQAEAYPEKSLRIPDLLAEIDTGWSKAES